MQLDPPPIALTDYKFEIVVRRLADDLKYGQDVSPYVGSGVDYVQSRPFEEGDSVRNIDWRVSARAGRYYVKQYEALKSTTVYLLVDTSASMAFHSTPLSKHFLAMLLSGGLGLAALGRMSPVGVLGCGDRKLDFRPSLNRGQILLLLHELRRQGFDEQTRLTQRLDEIQARLKHRSLIIVISDLHDERAVPTIRKLAQRHECAVLQLQDPAERGRLRAGLVRGVEAETGTMFVARGRSRWFDDENPRQELKSAGVDHLLLPTDRPFVPALRRFLAERGGLIRNVR